MNSPISPAPLLGAASPLMKELCKVYVRPKLAIPSTSFPGGHPLLIHEDTPCF